MTKATVAAIIAPSETEPDTILLTRRNVTPFKDRWCLPGGHIDAEETALTAVVREVAEETGLQFSNPTFLCYSNEIFPEHNFHAIALAFYGVGIGPAALMPDEVTEIAWFPLREALTLPLAFNHTQILQHYAEAIHS